MTLGDMEPRVVVHYGIPSTASILAYDPIQRILAVGTLDGRIKVIGGDNIEGLLLSSAPSPLKYLEFLQNQGFLVGVSNENEIQVWDLQNRHLASNLQWESNISAFSVIDGTRYIYVGDEYGFLSVIKYDAEECRLIHLPYQIPANLIMEESGITMLNHQPIVGLLPQPSSFGKRILIACQNGLIILWDVSEDRAVHVRDSNNLRLKEDVVVDMSTEKRVENSSDPSDDEQEEKEISAVCWVSSDGSALAIGYVDGDIWLWNLSVAASTQEQEPTKLNNAAIKLQLSSSDRRLPVIVLHWSTSSSHNGSGGQLFVYGGDEIGSEEVLTILSLDWSSGMEELKCTSRVDLTLHGSYADMALVPNNKEAESSYTSSFFVLTNPGQLHFYDDSCLSALISRPDRKHSVDSFQYPVVIPTIEPYMTCGRLFLIDRWGSLSRALEETVSAAKSRLASDVTTDSRKWPLTGGVPSPLSLDGRIERLYVAGYQDGFVRIWDATFPVLSLTAVLRPEVEGIVVPGASAPISALDFFSSTLSLAVGNECGLVRLHRLIGSSDATNLHLVTGTKSEVVNLPRGNEAQCVAVFSLLNSPVLTLRYILSGARLAVGFECGQIAMVDVNSPSVLFLTDSIVSPSCSVVSLVLPTHVPEYLGSTSDKCMKETAFIMTKDAHVSLMDCSDGNIICSRLMKSEKELTAISMYIVENDVPVSEVSEKSSFKDSDFKTESLQSDCKNESDISSEAIHSEEKNVDTLILLCCEDSLLLFSTKSLIEGEANFVCEVNLGKPCCWTTVFRKDETKYGLILVYLTGVIEIRSIPDLNLVGETSFMSILRWNFKANMEKMMSSSGTGQIIMVNGCEFAIISLLASENDLRIPEALPCLHDEVVAARADSSVMFFQNQKKKQSSIPGILGGLIKGLKRGKPDHGLDVDETREAIISKLEAMFSRFPFSVSSIDISNDQEDVAIDLDDIQIDEPVPVSSSSLPRKSNTIGMETDRESLFEGGSTDTVPRMRTAEEIRAKYRKTGDASSVAAQAKDKLMERQEKLEKLSRRTEELQSGAENFASMARELAKAMESRKWWQI